MPPSRGTRAPPSACPWTRSPGTSPRACPGERRRARRDTPVVVFPASALARKGALEMTEAMRRLGWRLLVPGTPATDATLWRGAALEKAVRDARGRTRSTLARA